jgi:hypothetical protein
LAFGVLVGNARAAAHRFERFEDVAVADAVHLEQVFGGRINLGEGQKCSLRQSGITRL